MEILIYSAYQESPCNKSLKKRTYKSSITLSLLPRRDKAPKSPIRYNPVCVASNGEIIRTFSRRSVDFRGHIVEDPRATFDSTTSKSSRDSILAVVPRRRLSMKHLSHNHCDRGLLVTLLRKSAGRRG